MTANTENETEGELVRLGICPICREPLGVVSVDHVVTVRECAAPVHKRTIWRIDNQGRVTRVSNK